MGRKGRKIEENQPLLVLFPSVSHIINCHEASKSVMHNFLKSNVIFKSQRAPTQVYKKYKIGYTQIEG